MKGENYMGILIRGGRIIDAATDTDKIGDIYLEDGMIKEIGDQLTTKEKSVGTIAVPALFSQIYWSRLR